MEKLAGRLVVISILIIAGLGVYVFNLRNQLSKAQATTALAVQNRDDFRRRLDDVNKNAGANTAALNTCTSQLKDAQAQLDAKRPAGRAAKH